MEKFELREGEKLEFALYSTDQRVSVFCGALSSSEIVETVCNLVVLGLQVTREALVNDSVPDEVATAAILRIAVAAYKDVISGKYRQDSATELRAIVFDPPKEGEKQGEADDPHK